MRSYDFPSFVLQPIFYIEVPVFGEVRLRCDPEVMVGIDKVVFGLLPPTGDISEQYFKNSFL